MCETQPLQTLALGKVRTVVWATGYALDFAGMLKLELPGLYDGRGYPATRDCQACGYAGLFFLGLHWLNAWKSAARIL